MYSPCVMLCSGSLLKGGLNIPQFPIWTAATGGQDKRCHASSFNKARMTIYGIHAYIILMKWSQCRIALGYNCLMLNIIQQVIDPMHTILSYIVLDKLLLLSLLLHLLQNYCYHCYRYRCYCYYYQNYQTTLLLITLLQIINLQVWLN